MLFQEEEAESEPEPEPEPRPTLQATFKPAVAPVSRQALGKLEKIV